MRWYRRVSANEIYNFEVFYHENIELKMRDMIRGIESSNTSKWVSRQAPIGILATPQRILGH
jgi:hypothetical protein